MGYALLIGVKATEIESVDVYKRKHTGGSSSFARMCKAKDKPHLPSSFGEYQKLLMFEPSKCMEAGTKSVSEW